MKAIRVAATLCQRPARVLCALRAATSWEGLLALAGGGVYAGAAVASALYARNLLPDEAAWGDGVLSLRAAMGEGVLCGVPLGIILGVAAYSAWQWLRQCMLVAPRLGGS